MDKKKLLSILFGVLFFTGCLSNFALASGLGQYGQNIDIRNMMNDLENVIWIVFSFIVVVMFVIAGIAFLTAQGEAEKIKTAKSSFIWGVVGVIVGIVAYSVIAIISNLFYYQ